jgi:predicted secreted protein
MPRTTAADLLRIAIAFDRVTYLRALCGNRTPRGDLYSYVWMLDGESVDRDSARLLDAMHQDYWVRASFGGLTGPAEVAVTLESYRRAP